MHRFGRRMGLCSISSPLSTESQAALRDLDISSPEAASRAETERLRIALEREEEVITQS